MKSLSRPSVATIVLFTLALSLPLFAQSGGGPSANGDFTFTSGNSSKRLVFDARNQNNGSTRGEMTLTGTESLPDQDTDGGGDANPGGDHPTMSITVEFDCLNVSGNRAVMSGAITNASVPQYIGLRIIFAVEDDGEGGKQPVDRFAWGVYRSQAITWTASDGELIFDPGVGMTWWATDAERNDDAGVSSNPGTSFNCQSFPLAAYSLEDVPKGGGNIQVRP
jgi:hypothetical protein